MVALEIFRLTWEYKKTRTLRVRVNLVLVGDTGFEPVTPSV